MTPFLLEEFAMAATNAGFVNINSDLGESFGPWVMGNAHPSCAGSRRCREQNRIGPAICMTQ